MRIKHIEVREFGPLQGFSADLAPGVNLIEGANESGKSSLIGFIRFILYGLPARRGEEGVAERDRALSWSGSAADGSMTVENAGKEYRIERRAAVSGVRESCVDRVRMIDLSTGAEVHKGEVPGRVLLGVSQSVFDSTACVRQLNMGELDGTGVGEAVENMLFSADATVSVKNALNRLTIAKRSLKNARGEGKLTELERRRDELAGRLSAAERAAQNIREAEAQAERCRALSTEIRLSLNTAEDRLSAFESFQTLRRFDMLHAGERKIAELRGKKSELEANCGFGDRLPDREYAPSLDAAARRLGKAEAERLDAAESAQQVRLGKPERDDLADIGSDALNKFGADWENALPADYASRLSRLKTAKVAAALLIGVGVVLAAAGAAVFFASLLPTAAALSIAGAGLLLAVAGIICLAARASAKRRAAEMCASFSGGKLPLPNIGDVQQYAKLHTPTAQSGAKSEGSAKAEKKTKKTLPAPEEFSECVRRCADALRERNGLRELLAKLDEAHFQKTAAADAALAEARLLLAKGGVEAENASADELLPLLAHTASRARSFCEEKESLERDIEKYSVSVEESAAALSGADETALRARIAPVAASLEGQNLSDLKKARDYDRARLDKTEERRVELEKRLAALEATAEAPQRIYPQWEAAAKEAESCRRKLDAITLAASSIEGAGNSLRLGVTPRLRRDAGSLMSDLTGGAYTEFGVGTDLSVTLLTPAGTRPVSALSVGTRDAAYFSLRMALVGLLFPKSAPPLIFDEAFAMMDDDRAGGLLSALSSRSNANAQCLIFTCQKREKAALDQLGAKYNYIKLKPRYASDDASGDMPD